MSGDVIVLEKLQNSIIYTPAEVVCSCVEICDPQKGMSVYDPKVGLGGMLI
ncbi:hypothetical protein BTN49_0404 [Candidatus Enterovibrio escicola]|uniref:DNA methylase adenine-specific domain-containing protein n=1 Tax=Candidatus Enterovibrio escicola TaxID=1927127 RepID=A0A2A5T5L4_9GAMM|nr:hypothetical protein BTN49_0404 [Candidatus Enterovibrio escacola]